MSLKYPKNLAQGLIPLSNKLFGIAVTKPKGGIVLSAHINFSEDVLITLYGPIGINIDHGAIDLKHRDHFHDVAIHHQGMGFSRSLVNIGALGCYPIMFEVSP